MPLRFPVGYSKTMSSCYRFGLNVNGLRKEMFTYPERFISRKLSKARKGPFQEKFAREN